MSSPFPGMDPWLEDPAIFPDLHDSFIVELRKVIMARLPLPYYAAIKNRVWVDLSLRHIEPDVDVLYPSVRAPKRPGAAKKSRATMAEAAKPMVIHVPGLLRNDDMEEWLLEIFAKPGDDQLVTSIELLSLSNKNEGSRGRELYKKKQDEVLNGKTNLVEIDLLRRGVHTSAIPLPVLLAETGAFDYHVVTHRMDDREHYYVYPWQLDERLPSIAIPLLPDDPTVLVDLQGVLDECFESGGYLRRMRYRSWKPKPPLAKKQKEWAERILKSKGL